MAVIQDVKYVLIAIPVVIMLCALVLIMGQRRENLLRQTKMGVRALKKWIIPVFILAVLYGAAWLGVNQMQISMQASVIIGFNYPEASSGLNPNRTRFNISEILSDNILEKAITDGNLNNVSVDDLKQSLSVTPLQAGDSISTNQVYMSTEYQLTYEASKNTLQLDPGSVVDAVAEAYCQEFVSAYSRKTDVLTMDFSDLEDLDYLDIVNLFDKKSESVEEYANLLSYENASFQSETTGETFSSIAEKIRSFREVQLDRFESFILSNGLAKNRDQYIAKLNYDNTITHLDYLKNLATHNINLDAIDRYERDMATIVLIPSEDLDGEFYMSRTKIGVDYFAENAELAMQSAAKHQQDMQFNDYAISQMMAAGRAENRITQVENMLESLKSEYQVYAGLLADTLADYDKKTTNDYVSVVSARITHIGSREIGRAVVLAVIFSIVFCVLIVAMSAKNGSSYYGKRERIKKKNRAPKKTKGRSRRRFREEENGSEEETAEGNKR